MDMQKREILTLVETQRQEGRTVGDILNTVGIPRANYYRWKTLDISESETVAQHPLALTPTELHQIDQAKRDHPHLRHRKIQGVLQAGGLYLSPTAVYKRLKSQGNVEPYERRPSPLKKASYDIWQRNLVWGSDWTKLRIAGIRWQLLTLIDFFSRFLLAYRILPSVNASHIKEIYSSGLRFQDIARSHPDKPKLRVDQGSPNTSSITREFFEIIGADLSFARVRRPTDNAITERFYGSFKQEEFYLVGDYPDELSAKQEIGTYIDYYNYGRPHQALWNFTPAYIHQTNNKTEVIKTLATLKMKTRNQRKNYWISHNQPTQEKNDRRICPPFDSLNPNQDRSTPVFQVQTFNEKDSPKNPFLSHFEKT